MNKTTEINLRNFAMSDQASQRGEVGKAYAVEHELLERIHFSLDGAKGNAATLLEHSTTTKPNSVLESIYRREIDQAQGLMKEIEGVVGESFGDGFRG